MAATLTRRSDRHSPLVDVGDLWRVGAAWLITSPILNVRVRPRRVPLWDRRRRVAFSRHSQRTYFGKSGHVAGSRNSEASSSTGAITIERSMACSMRR